MSEALTRARARARLGRVFTQKLHRELCTCNLHMHSLNLKNVPTTDDDRGTLDRAALFCFFFLLFFFFIAVLHRAIIFLGVCRATVVAHKTRRAKHAEKCGGRIQARISSQRGDSNGCSPRARACKLLSRHSSLIFSVIRSFLRVLKVATTLFFFRNRLKVYHKTIRLFRDKIGNRRIVSQLFSSSETHQKKKALQPSRKVRVVHSRLRVVNRFFSFC